MRLDGRRESNNVEDRRGSSGRGLKLGLGGGIGSILFAALIVWLSGGNPIDVISSQSGNLLQQDQTTEYTPSAEEEELATFTKKILAGTEDVWTEEFRKMGKTYIPPKLVMFTGSVNSACGQATSAVGPFYCSGDRTVYIDLSFFKQMEREMGAGGDFAYAYVIAHEVGHHVQNLLGDLSAAHEAMSRVSDKEANKISVATELQADFYAGIWAYHDNRLYGSLEEGDIEEGINAASKIGDDYLQKQAQGYAVPETFNHGTSAQRMRWLTRGAKYGDITQGDTFSIPYNSL